MISSYRWSAVRLLMGTGRRPDEVCSLPWDCLERGADGKHVLVYRNAKANRVARRLPISDTTGALIRQQQQLVLDRYPDTLLAEFALLPRPKPIRAAPARSGRGLLPTPGRTRWISVQRGLRLAQAV
jgi:integrase